VPSQQARAFWVSAPGEGVIVDETLQPPGEGQALVRARFSGISRGTEVLVFSGRVPGSERHRMRAPFQEGEFPAPVKYGYCSVGVVERGPSELVGHNVFCLYPHQSRYVAPADALYRLPDGVPAERAVLAANLETALNGLWDGELKAGDRVVVVGAGTVGCLAAWLAAQVPGCDVCLVDINRARAGVAAALGVKFAVPVEAPSENDLVFHTSGSADGLSTAMSLAAFEATIVEMSWYGVREVHVPLGAAFHSRRLTIRSSQVGHVAAANRARWTYRRRMELALSLLASTELDVLITGESAFEDLPAVMRELASGARDALCHRIRY
jgi:threonine dehydrogenase-like Zn-dependent dehydrogenase